MPLQYRLQDMILTLFADLSFVPDMEDINNISLRLWPSVTLQHFIIIC